MQPLNLRRKYNAGNHRTPAIKTRRKILRGLKKKKVDKYVRKEGESYEPGGH